MYAKPTDRVGIIGIGGLGHMAVQCAAAYGCDVTAFRSSASTFEEAKSFGAHHVVSSNDSAAAQAHRAYSRRGDGALVHYDWPGNVRELQNVMERGVILAANGVLRPQVPTRSAGVRRASPVATMSATLDDAMRAHILDALRTTNWVVAGPHGAATRLGMKRTTLLCRMAKLGIVRPLGLTPP